MSVGGGILASEFPIKNDTTLDPKLIHYCAPKHWDPTMVFRYSVPGGMEGTSLPLPMDPRPWVKINQAYVNSGAAEPAPRVPASFVIPGAGQFYPPGRYAESIDKESVLERLDRPLNHDLMPGGCFAKQFILPETSDVYQQWSLLPPQIAPKSKMVRDLADPPVLERKGQYACSEQAMACGLMGAKRFFNNATSLTKYNQKDQVCGNTLWQTNDGQNPSSTNLPTPTQH